MFGNKKVNELNEKIINIISFIENNNHEAHKILNEAGKKLAKFEETYETLKKENNNILPKSDIFIKAYKSTLEGGKTVESFLEILGNKKTSILEKNNIYPILIDVINGMTLSYSIMINEFKDIKNL